MKKIWPWLLLLLLLIIFCVWSKKDSIYTSLNTHNQSATLVPASEDEHSIDYVIQQQNNTDYTLNGNFSDTQQAFLIAHTFTLANKKLTIDDTQTDETLKSIGVIALTNKILPHFIETYENGKIVYQNQKMLISGTAKSYEAQHQMQALLNSSTIASQDNSNVAMTTSPIVYQIDKNPNSVHATGTFGNDAQISSIKQHLPEGASSNFKIKPHSVDKGSLAVVGKFLPFFLEKYTTGNIIYDNESLTVSGYVSSQETLDKAHQFLTGTNVTIADHTQIDPKILEQVKMETKELELQRKAEAEAIEKARLAEEKAAKAKLEAEAKKAKLAEVKELTEAKKLELQRKAEAEAIEKARLDMARNAARAKLLEEAKKAELKNRIATLFKLENIEFNVNKSTLTTKGQDTVNKLATILHEYTSVNIEIAGHTDADGSAKYNQRLSQSRVDTVKSTLANKGINASRLTAKGYGETRPLVPNTTRKNKAKNRRVEINILGE